MKPYYEYIENVLSGKKVACELIQLACKRFNSFLEREDMFFDEEEVDRCIAFYGALHHFKGKSVNTPFILSDFQTFMIASILGFKWVDTKYRVCREVYIETAKKSGKDAWLAGLSLYLLLCDNEASPEVDLLANSREQTSILFDYINEFASQIDGKEKYLKRYKKHIDAKINKGRIKCYSSDASKLDGINPSVWCIDEYHEADSRAGYDNLKSASAMRTSPLGVVITTAGFNLSSPCHDLHELCIEILHGVKTDDTQQAFIFQLNEGDDWTDPANFIKCQPNLGITVDEAFMIGEVNKVKNDPTAEVGVKTKTFNMWCQSSMVWLSQERVAKCMKNIDLHDYQGYTAYIGVDLSAVNDLTSMSVFIPISEDKYVLKSFCFLPEDTILEHPNRELYKKFHQEGDLILTPGNIVDYDYITKVIHELSEYLHIEGIYYDPYNSGTWAIQCTDIGYNMQPVSQGLMNFNNPTREFEKMVLGEEITISKSSMFVWCIGNVVLKEDWNNNRKPMKSNARAKIDPIISSIMAVKGYLGNPIADDFSFTSVW